ncbi:MAG: hypothetical protein KDE08_05325 [Rhodobacteraceae bacterium]|nr:hypothetical protein [Paracoccaceae bacterium]
MSFSEFETWFLEHQVLILSVVIPLASAIIASLASWYATRRTLAGQKTERNLNRVLKLSDFRQDWTNELRSEFAQYLAILLGQKPISHERINEMALFHNKIILRMNHEDEDFETLMNAMSEALQAAKSDSPMTNQRVELTIVMSRILKREWERLKHDMRESEYGGGV